MQLMHFIICDDVRTELGQKHSLMGLLDDDITLQPPAGFVGQPITGPIGLPLAAHVRLKSEPGEALPDLAELTVTSNGNEIARAVGGIHIGNPGRSINLAVMMGIVPIPAPGEIILRLAIRSGEITLLQTERRMQIRIG